MATTQSNHAYIPVIVFRTLLWAMTVGLFLAGVIGPNLLITNLHLVLIAASALYTVMWSVGLHSLARLATRYPALLLLDLLLSALPAWLSGGWSSPFLPLMFGALMLPGALFHWRGALIAVGSYLVVDQLIGWTTRQAGGSVPFVSPLFVVGYLRPIIAATIWPLSFELWKWRTRHAPFKPPVSVLPEQAGQPATERMLEMEHALAVVPQRETGTTLATALGLTRHRSQTLERPPLVELYSALRQMVSEAEERGMSVEVVLDGKEPVLPAAHVQVLAKAVEVGLENIRCHAHTRSAEVTLTQESDQRGQNLLLIIRDHGIGLQDGTAEPPGFHQVKRLRYRLEELEGSLQVRDDEAGGVVFIVRLPHWKAESKSRER